MCKLAISEKVPVVTFERWCIKCVMLKDKCFYVPGSSWCVSSALVLSKVCELVTESFFSFA